MAFDASKTLMLEKQYLYVKASKGFQLEGVSTERIWTNTGYYRFLVDNVARALSNSYIKILYDSTDTEFVAYCSDLFLEEIQSTIVVAVENLEAYLQQFAEANHDDIMATKGSLDTLSTGLSGSQQAILTAIVALMGSVGSSSTLYDIDAHVNGLKGPSSQTLSDVVRNISDLQGSGSRTLTDLYNTLGPNGSIVSILNSIKGVGGLQASLFDIWQKIGTLEQNLTNLFNRERHVSIDDLFGVDGYFTAYPTYNSGTQTWSYPTVDISDLLPSSISDGAVISTKILMEYPESVNSGDVYEIEFFLGQNSDAIKCLVNCPYPHYFVETAGGNMLFVRMEVPFNTPSYTTKFNWKLVFQK